MVEAAGLSLRFSGLVAFALALVSGPVRAEEGHHHPVVWVGLHLEQDLAFASGTDVCTKDSQLNEGFACFRSSGSQYHGTPRVGVRDNVDSGLLVATTRMLLSGDYALSDSVTLGARAGYVLRGGGPTPDGCKPFIPYHLEGRASLWLLGQSYGDAGIQPFLFAGGGLAQVDGSLEVVVAEDANAPPPPNQPDNPPTQTLDVYKKAGSGFAKVGVGAYTAIGEHHGAVLELGAMQLFPSSGTAIALSLGYVLGV